MSVITDFADYVETNICGRVYPSLLPDNVIYPCIRYQVVTMTPNMTMDGESQVKQANIQLSIFATSYADARTTADLARSTLSGYSGTMGDTNVLLALVQGFGDLYEDEIKIFHTPIEVALLYTDEGGS